MTSADTVKRLADETVRGLEAMKAGKAAQDFPAAKAGLDVCKKATLEANAKGLSMQVLKELESRGLAFQIGFPK